ncbi:MAG: HlyD family efflux transporter periplasmic adaptor subunit [Planctomycetota bacterium]
MELREADPTGSVQLTGAVTAWSESDVAFEVEGRVAYVVEGGTDLAGRWEEDGEVRVTGDVLARLDTQTYEIRLDHARAVLAAAQGELAAAVVELERVLPATVAAARANRDRALAEVERTRAAREKNAISELDLIRSEADWQQRKADYERAVASVEAQRVALDALGANVETARENVRAAEYDLERCTLYAPFEGEVSTVHIEAGGYARRAEPVAHIVMMDPMTVELAVSSARATDVNLGQTVQVFLPGHDEVAFGTVYEKATVADAATRTFTVKVAIRNQRRYGAVSSGNPALAQPRIADTMYANRLVPGDPSSPLFVEERRAVQRDASGRTFVWAAPGHRVGDVEQLEGALVTLNRVEVKLGPERRNFQGRYLMRELSDPGGVEEGMLIALDVPADVTDGQEVLLARDRWLLRPGMLVRVVLDLDPPEPGLYVPLSAMRPGEAGLGRIFLAEGGRVRPVEVRTVGTLREFARIEAVDGGALEAGAKVVVDHVHFLQAGEPVSVVRTLEFTP